MELRTSTKWLAVVRNEHWVVAKVKRSKEKIEVEQLAEFDVASSGKEEEEFPEEVASEDGYPRSPQETKGPVELGLRLRQWLKREKIPLNRIKMAFSCPGVITRVITLPELSKKDLDTLLTDEVEQYFTLKLEDYLVDYRVLDHYREDGEFRVRVLLAALPKEPWVRFWQICHEAGLNVKVVDLAADSILRLYAWSEALTSGRKPYRWKSKLNSNYQRLLLKDRLLKRLPDSLADKLKHRRSKERSKGLLARLRVPVRKKKVKQEADLALRVRDSAIVSLHQGRVEIIILEHGVFFLYSDLNFLWEPNRAEGFREQQQTIGPVRENIVSAISSHNFYRESLDDALAPIIRVLMEFINFFAARHFGKPVDDIFLTGELADTESLADVFTEKLGIQVNVGFPNGWKPIFRKKVQDRNQQWMKYADLYGLALRED